MDDVGRLWNLITTYNMGDSIIFWVLCDVCMGAALLPVLVFFGIFCDRVPVETANGVQVIAILVLPLLVHYVFLVLKYPRIMRFTLGENGRFLPLLPFVGNVYVALFTGIKLNMLSTLLWAERYLGMPVNFWFGNKYHYMCDNAEEARIVLNHSKCLNKAQLYNDVQYIFNNSILLIPGEKWKGRRRCLKSSFKTNYLQTLTSIFYHQSCLLNEKLKSIKPEDDLFIFFNSYAFTVFFLTSSSSGLCSDTIDSNFLKIGSLISRIQDEFVKLLINPLIPAALWMKLPAGRKFRKIRQELFDTLKQVVEIEKKLRENTPEYFADASQLPLLDLLLSDGYDKAQESDIYEEYTLFAGAATDTTGHTLTFCFTLLGMHPEIQQLVYKEVISEVGDGPIDNNNLSNLVYTEAVINESLRILPSIPLYGRYCSEDIDIGTKIVPKGANVFISAFHIHRNEQYWRDPLKFDPSRFLPENSSKIVPGSFVAFSAGPRNCIGQNMAMTILKITIANVVRHFSISSRHKSIDEFVLVSCISMKTLDPLDCSFVPRTV